VERAERIETTRFLGSEFIVLLWFASEALEGAVDLPELGRAELWLDTLLVLQAPEDKTECVTLRGLAPSGGEEARTALAEGKLPTQARVHVRLEPRDFAFVLRADTLQRSGVVLPAQLREAGDERFYERLALLEECDRILGALWRDFAQLRTSALWGRELTSALRAWVKDGNTPSAAQLRAWIAKARR
jgi:hypothetical protein